MIDEASFQFPPLVLIWVVHLPYYNSYRNEQKTNVVLVIIYAYT